MKFKVGKIPVNERVDISGWNLLKKPKNFIIMQIVVFPIGIILTYLKI